MAGRKVYDLNRLRKTYPLRRKRPSYAVVDSSYNENAVIECDSDTVFPVSYSFDNTYSSIPVCIASIENFKTNVFITSLDTSSVSLNIGGRIPEGTIVKIHLQVYSNQGD